MGWIWMATVVVKERVRSSDEDVSPAWMVFLDFGHFTGVWEDKISTGANVVLAKWDKGI